MIDTSDMYDYDSAPEEEHSELDELEFKHYVVAIFEPKKDYEIKGPFFLEEDAEQMARYFTTEYYSKRYYDKVVLVTVPIWVDVCKLYVERWDSMYETKTWSRRVDELLEEI